MDYFYSIFDNFRYFYSSLNPTILSGAIDVVVVEQPDGRYLSTPFHVRFGKYGVFNNTDKYVDIRINGQEVDFKMKLDADGVAFFVEEITSGEQVPRYLATSPVRSAPSPTSRRKTFADLPRNKEGKVLQRRRSSEAVLRRNKRPSSKSIQRALRKKGVLRGSLSDTQLAKRRNPVKVNPSPPEWKWGEIPLTPSSRSKRRRKRVRLDRKAFSSPTRTPSISPPGDSIPSDDAVQVEMITANYKRSLRLSDQQLRRLGLSYGANEARFSVTTRFQGTAWCICQIYLLRWSNQLVISDIDGTITKSDVLGHVFAAIGGTWAHTGVADLFERISLNGYQMIYLSSRAIGMSTHTKQYLKTLKQGTKTLPDGPILLSPTSIFVALRREVIQRCPEKFKISCLMDLKNLFPNRQPFFAGFGNRITDVKSYEAVNVPPRRIFIINPSGVVVRADGSFFTTNYVSMATTMADFMFPPIFRPKFGRKSLKEFSRPEDRFYASCSWERCDRTKDAYHQRLTNAEALADYEKRSAELAERKKQQRR